MEYLRRGLDTLGLLLNNLAAARVMPGLASWEPWRLGDWGQTIQAAQFYRLAACR